MTSDVAPPQPPSPAERPAALRDRLRQLTLSPAALGLQIALGAVAMAAPLLRPAGYKPILILGLLSHLALPIAWLLRPRQEEAPLMRRLATFMALALTPVALATLGALLLTQGCEVADGWKMALVGTAPGAALAFGLCELLEAPRPSGAPLLPRWARVVAWVGVWLAGLAWCVGWFLTEPVYQIAHPLAGMLYGPPNETQDPWMMRARWFAVEVLGWAALALLTAWIARSGWARRPWWPWAALATLAAAQIAWVSQDAALGYRIDRDHVVTEELWVQREHDNLAHQMSPLIPSDAIPWLMLEAEFQRARQMKLLGLTDATMPRAVLHWYRDREHKRQVTGAARTKFAKVHLHELYISADVFPPRVLGHELAHITSGAFSDNLLRVPGRLGGLWYNPALVEGFAVAVDSSDVPLSAHEKTRVALDADRVPPLEELFSPLGFVNTNLSVAYRASGSFVRYGIDTWGPEPILRWFGSERFEESVGMPLADAERQWRAWLGELELREADVGAVNRIQTRPAIGQEQCGRSDASIALEHARAARGDEAFNRAFAQLEPGLDPDAAWLTRAEYEATRAHYQCGLTELPAPDSRCDLPDPPPVALSDDRASQYTHLVSLAAWARGDTSRAIARMDAYPTRLKRSNRVIFARVLLRDGFDFTLARPPDTANTWFQEARAWERTRHPAVGLILAHRLARAQDWASLAEVTAQLSWEGFAFPDDLPGTLPLDSLELKAKAAFALRRWDEAEAAWAAYADAAPTQGRRDYGQTWLERARFFRSRAERVTADLPPL